MNSADDLELQLIRDEQAEIIRQVRDLDSRIDLLARRFETPAASSVRATPPPLPVVAPSAPALPVASHLTETPSSAAAPEIAMGENAPSLIVETATTPSSHAATEPTEPLELRLGTYWMARIGIVILLTGLVFLGNYAYHRIIPMLGEWGKLSLLALAGVALGGFGAWLERSRESMRSYARVLLAGGAATIYYTAYAAHYVEGLRVIESPLLGGGLLLALAGSFLWWADRRRSEALAVPAVLLAYYTSAINPTGTFTLFSNLVLTGAAVFLLVRRRWTRLTYLSLAATYGSYAFWRFHQWEAGGASNAFGIGLTFVAAYWVLFTAAAFLASSEVMRGPQRVAFLTANNGAFFAFAAQHYATHRPDAFWIFALGYGVVLLGLAALAVRVRNEERALDGAFLAQGLALATLGLAAKLTGPQLAVVLAVESAALLAGSRRRHGWLYEAAAALCAMGATGVALFQINRHAVAPLALGGPVVGLLLFNAWWAKRARGSTERFSQYAFGFAALGLVLLASLIWNVVGEPWQPAAYALVAGVSLIALRVRLLEVALPGQAFLLLALGVFVTRFDGPAPAPWWSPLPLALAAIGLMHWWQRQRSVEFAEQVRAFCQLACAAVAVITGAVWMHHFVSGDGWLIATSGAALGTLLYGMLTRGWALAVAGQAFTVLAISSFAAALLLRHPAWAAALAPIVNVGLTSLIVARLSPSRLPAIPVGVSAAQIAHGYQILALAMLGAWAFEYVTPPWRVAWFAGFGALLLLAGALTKQRERMLSGAAYAAVAFVLFWLRSSQAGWADLLAILAVPAALRIGRWFAGESPLLPALRNGLVLAATASLWLWTTRWTLAHGYSEQLTTAWAVLALAIFAAGLGLRERIYRVGGFAILGLAVGRLFIIDVWRFDTLLRIVSFLVLGVVLLGLSFVYNRFSETMRRWL